MKKIILSVYLAGIAFFFGYSQMNLTLSDSLGPLPNDTTIIKQGLPSVGEIISYIFVKNNTANNMQVKVKKVELSLIPGSLNYFCWGLCYANTIYISPVPVEIPAGTTNSTDFSGHYSPLGTVGASTLRYVFFDMNNPSDTACVNVTYDTYPLGVENTFLKDNYTINAYPNPADKVVNFHYKVSKGASASVKIRNILGTVVKESDLNDPEGTISINVNDLDDGIYFYSLIENGMPVSTKKLIVKH